MCLCYFNKKNSDKSDKEKNGKSFIAHRILNTFTGYNYNENEIYKI